jgi:hypothetical protein
VIENRQSIKQQEDTMGLAARIERKREKETRLQATARVQKKAEHTPLVPTGFKPYYAELVAFGHTECEGGVCQIKMDKGHVELLGEFLGTKAKFIIGRRSNGDETRLPVKRLIQYLDGLGLSADPPPDNGWTLETNDYGDEYVVIPFRR